MKNHFLIFTFILIIKSGLSQNLVGMNSDQIFSFLHKKGISVDSIETAKNKNGSNYISYDNKQNKIIYFLNSSMVCYCYRVIYSNEELDKVIKQLNERFRRLGENRWLDDEDVPYEIILEQKKDFFVTDMFAAE